MDYTIVVSGLLFVLALWAINKWLDTSKGRGYLGERSVNSELNKLDKDIYTVIPDVMLKKADRTTSQIDAIVISKYGIFVIEAKNYTGKIRGKVRADRWKQVLHSRQNPYFFQNPIHQNFGHIKTLEEVIGIEYKKMHNIVVFAGTAKWRKRPAKSVLYTRELNKYIIEKKNVLLTENSLEDIKNKIADLRITGIFKNKEHIENIQERLENN